MLNIELKKENNLFFKSSITLIVVVGLVFSFYFFNKLNEEMAEKKQIEFESLFERKTALIENELNNNLNILLALKSYSNSSTSITRNNFKKFVQQFLDNEDFNGLHAISWVPRVLHKDRLEYENRLKKELNYDFKIKQKDENGKIIYAKNKADYFSVDYIEPYELNKKAQVSVDIVIRNLFERTADIGFLSTDDDIRLFLNSFKTYDEQTLVYNLKDLRKRFKEYVAKYSVYYDIVLFDENKNILLNLDDTLNTDFRQSQDTIFELIDNSKEDYVETYKKHDFDADLDNTLVYSFKVTKSKDDNTTIGYLALCFKFEDEMKTIYSNLIDKSNKEVLLLLDNTGKVISSSDHYHIPLGAVMEMEFDKPFAITQFAGRDYIIKTCKTNGYEEFYGLGWYGHIMIPLDSAFKFSNKQVNLDENVLKSIMQNEKLFKKELSIIPKKAEVIQDELDRAVWNGNISQIQYNQDEEKLSRSILREIKSSGEKTKTVFQSSINRLNQTIVNSLLDNVSFLASLSIDIMDRNLYERANDCRWWALTSKFNEILKKGHLTTVENFASMTEILKYINSLYTVYTNLFIYDKNAAIISVSNDDYKHLINRKLNEKWIDNTLKIDDSSRYYVSYFDKTYLYNDDFTFIFNAAINDEDNSNLGGIGIVFDSRSQFKQMLNDALPKDNEGKVLDGYFSLFVEKNYSTVLSCSNDSHEIGEKVEIDKEFLNLKKGQSLSKIVEYKGKYYLVGCKCSNGYREYKNSSDIYQKEIFSFVFVEAGKILNSELNALNYSNNFFTYDESYLNNNYEEVATFYIGNKWLGIKASEIIEATSVNNLEKPISIEDSIHHFKGTIIHKKLVVSVLDISKFIDNNNLVDHENEIVIVKYNSEDETQTIGLIVDKLGEIVKVPKDKIKPFQKHLIGGGFLGESIVTPPENSHVKSLITLLNISKLDNLTEKV